MKIIKQGFLLSRHCQDYQQHTTMTLWLSTDNGPAKLLVSHEQPTFFVRQYDQTVIGQALGRLFQRCTYKTLALATFDQEPVAALYFSTLRDYYEAQALLKAAHISFFEADIRLHDRYLMERFVYGSMEFTGKQTTEGKYIAYHDARIRPARYLPRLKVISLDIECSASGELYSIGLYGQHNHTVLQYVLMIGANENSDSYIHWLDDEKALLGAFITLLQELDPDIIIGWNVINFDCRLLMQRAQLHGMELILGRDNSAATWRNNRNNQQQGFISITGRVVVDGIDALKTATYNFSSFSLENVAQALLGRGKKTANADQRLDEITADFLHNKQKLAAYNLADCILVWDIFEKTRLLDFLVFRSQITGLELDKQGGSVAAFTNLYLPHLHRAGYVAPNLPRQGGLASPGGYVMNSRPGLYRNIIVLDYKSLYPSIIRTFKIDPLGLVEGLLHPQQAINGFKGALFSRDRHFLPAIITQLWQQRDEAKKQDDAARSQALKIIMNSFYGVLGSGGCRFYDARLASSITLRGHEIIQQTVAWIMAMGYEVIYGDTDSIFISLPDDCDHGQSEKIALALGKEINDNWTQKLQAEQQLECYLEIEFDQHYSRFFMPTIRGSEEGSKKRYVGLVQKTVNGQPEEEIVFKGLESVRTDWTELAKVFQRQLFDCVFHDQDPTRFIRETLEQTRAGLRDDQLVYRKRLRQPLHLYTRNVPPHVKAARMADEHNRQLQKPLQYQNKGWIDYVITTQGPEPLQYQENPLDYEHYIDRQLRPIAEAILPLLGIDFDSLSQQQLGLFQDSG